METNVSELILKTLNLDSESNPLQNKEGPKEAFITMQRFVLEILDQKSQDVQNFIKGYYAGLCLNSFRNYVSGKGMGYKVNRGMSSQNIKGLNYLSIFDSALGKLANSEDGLAYYHRSHLQHAKRYYSLSSNLWFNHGFTCAF